MIATLRHLRALRSEARSASNRHVPSGTVAAHVRMATGTSRRKSADVRFVRRMRMRGKQPRCLDEIVVSPRLAENAIYIKRDKSITVLARDWSMRLASATQRMCVDGTFRSVPRTHYQLLTFHAVCTNGVSFPVIYALVTNKNYVTYKKVLAAIQRHADELQIGNVFSRDTLTVSVDFEAALIKAFVKIGATVHGCFFHLCQAIWRVVCNNGLKQKYNTDRAFRTAVRALMALACLKADDIPRFYEQIRRKIGGDKALCVVSDYFKATWIDGFGVDIICQYNKVFRTNNNAEAFHSLLQCVFPPHLRFDDFIEKVCDSMDTTEVDSNAERLRPRSLKRSISVPHERISNLVNNFYNDRALALPLDAVLDEIGDDPPFRRPLRRRV